MNASNTAILRAMFEEHYTWLRSRLWRRLGCSFSAEDVAAESFARTAERTDLHTIVQPRAFLTTVAQRIVYDLWRRQDLERAVMDALAVHQGQEMQTSVEDVALLLESLVAVDRVLGGLSAEVRDAFLFHQLDGLTYDDIGARLGIPASVARRYVAKALRHCYAAVQD